MIQAHGGVYGSVLLDKSFLVITPSVGSLSPVGWYSLFIVFVCIFVSYVNFPRPPQAGVSANEHFNTAF